MNVIRDSGSNTNIDKLGLTLTLNCRFGCTRGDIQLQPIKSQQQAIISFDPPPLRMFSMFLVSSCFQLFRSCSIVVLFHLRLIQMRSRFPHFQIFHIQFYSISFVKLGVGCRKKRPILRTAQKSRPCTANWAFEGKGVRVKSVVTLRAEDISPQHKTNKKKEIFFIGRQTNKLDS